MKRVIRMSLLRARESRRSLEDWIPACTGMTANKKYVYRGML